MLTIDRWKTKFGGQLKLTLDDAARMLDLGAHAGLAMLLLLDRLPASAIGQLGKVTGPRGNMPLQVLALHARLRASVS